MMGFIADILGLGDDGSAAAAAQQQAQQQADETRKAAAAQAEQARFQAQAAQIQREGLAARSRAEQTAQDLAAQAKPAGIAEVVVGAAPEVDTGGKRKRTPRAAFNRPKADASSITI